MAGAYTIFGRTVQSHTLAIATLTTAGAVAYYLSRNSSNSKKGNNQVPMTSGSTDRKDEIDVEKVINNFLKDQDNEKPR
ncbi:hypothetical protein KAFR_0C05830 [Kazachstania africana CBS 2517]|uniref:Uncharacterized protein n=1 Tax=Kazachstania africana (strain ATCC 22294 / BCRC 22015 / CBS 2517 / CECT 1963 / NBRC 1671 / NRRL Y-8276) TaxID=1071382 RepID=H2AT74_KAZAF|nr:hypothetical protein KAFR_0C05830 [Kazachstania africana CBS 2517]CCF57574.1 hypothetical protein KAFR_0C05830 [Kazachstania africana CBS 2517]